MLNFTTLSNSEKTNHIKILVYGQAGMGKTVLCVTAPRPIIISAEGGLLSLRKRNIIKMFGKDNPDIIYEGDQIPILKITSIEELKEAYDFCANSPHMNNFDTICIDSLSEIAEKVLNNLKPTHKDPRKAYGEMLDLMEIAIRLFRDLPKNVYMSAKLEPLKDELTGVIKYGPSMPGQKLGPKLPYFFDEVFRIGVSQDPNSGQLYRFLQTQPDLQYEAKDRSGSLDPLEKPSLKHVFNKILE